MKKLTTDRLVTAIAVETGQNMVDVEKMLKALTGIMRTALFQEQTVEFTGLVSIVAEARVAEASWRFGKLHESRDRIHFSVLKSRHIDAKYRQFLVPKKSLI